MVRIVEPVDPRLEMAAIQRRVFEAGGPALYFENPKGGKFPMVSNLFGTMNRLEYLFRDTIPILKRAMEWGIDPAATLSRGFPSLRMIVNLARTGLKARPKMTRRAAVLQNEIRLTDLPQLVSWHDDGGPYITLPQVYTESVAKPGIWHSNLGMYRVQLAGNDYKPNEDVGIHYQLHRGIANHHAEAIAGKTRLPVNIFVGGAPAMSVAAVMPLPEGMSELTFAGMLGNHRIPMSRTPFSPLPVYAEADFCLSGYLDDSRLLREGPFGDHLGYYSLEHEFPVMKVEHVWHRDGAIWPFTVVGRPPQEDTMFGKFIHELTGPIIPKKIAGVRAVHAVDEAGVHPLLLVLGSERYTPYNERNRAAELHTIAYACLGFGQLSLAKCIFLAAAEDDPNLDVRQTDKFLIHVLERFRPEHDLHFITQTNCDTLDYTGGLLNRGSKLIVAAVGKPIRRLPTEFGEIRVPEHLGFHSPKIVFPGCLVIQSEQGKIEDFTSFYNADAPINEFPLIVIVDDSRFAAESLRNFLWVTFTRCDPAADIHGIGVFTDRKHWACRGSLVIDARIKPHHAPALVEDESVTARITPIVDSILEGGSKH